MLSMTCEIVRRQNARRDGRCFPSLKTVREAFESDSQEDENREYQEFASPYWDQARGMSDL
jgi:hypothetical protein